MDRATIRVDGVTYSEMDFCLAMDKFPEDWEVDLEEL